MTEQELKMTVAKNISEYRKLNKMTQSELAERLNYSDKSVSKWERGEGLPDVYVLYRIAELFDLQISTLCSPSQPKRIKKRGRQHVLITLLSIAVVWLLATVTFMIMRMLPTNIDGAWLTFICAIPVSAVVFTVFSSIWWGQVMRFLSISALLWSVATCVFLFVNIEGIYLIWCVAAVLQIMEILWFRLAKVH